MDVRRQLSQNQTNLIIDIFILEVANEIKNEDSCNIGFTLFIECGIV